VAIGGCLEVFASALQLLRMAREELANRQDSVLLARPTAERVFKR